jgi:Na+/proline symporter
VKYRLAGLVGLLACAIFVYIGIYDPITEALAHKESMSDPSDALYFLPLGVLLSLGLLGGGQLFLRIVAKDDAKKSPTAAGWVLFVVGMGLGFLLVSKFHEILTGLGYRFGY